MFANDVVLVCTAGDLGRLVAVYDTELPVDDKNTIRRGFQQGGGQWIRCIALCHFNQPHGSLAVEYTHVGPFPADNVGKNALVAGALQDQVQAIYCQKIPDDHQISLSPIL